MAESTGLIHYRCAATGHQQGVVGRTADTLTIHDGKWAYCPMDVRESGHKWEATGGVAIETLRRGTPNISLDLNVRPHTSAPASPSAKRPSAVPTEPRSTVQRKRLPPK